MDVAIQASAAARLNPESDDDLCDRLLRKYTFVIFISFGVLCSFSGYWGESIACAVQANYADGGAYTTYMDNICYLGNTYRMTSDSENFKEAGTQENMIVYYQWTFAICLISILNILLPSCAWRSCAPSYRNIAQIPHNYSFILSQPAQRTLCTKASQKILEVCTRKRDARRLTNIYIGIKVLTILTLLANIALFAVPIGTLNPMALWHYDRARISPNNRFPQVVHCWAQIPSQSTAKYNTVYARCVLPNNILHYYFFAFALHWFLFLLVISVCNLVYWCVLLYSHGQRCKYILSHLHCMVDPGDLHRFVTMLGHDGVLMIALMSNNGSDLFSSIITEQVFKTYLTSKLNLEE